MPHSNTSNLELLTQRYWKASLAWKNVDDWAVGWTQGSFIEELRALCCSPLRVGDQADKLLDQMVHDCERVELESSAQIINLGK